MNKLKILLLIFAYGLFGQSCSSEDTIEPIVIIATPLVEFTYAPNEPRAKEEANFTGRYLTGSSVITSWKWNFGDADNSTSSLQNPTFVYPQQGEYTVTLTASDANEAFAVYTQNITIGEALPDPFTASLAWSFTNNTAVPNYNDGSSSPVIGDDGAIYYLESYAGAESRMVAVNDLGSSATKKWDAALGYNLRSAPSMDPDGNLYIGAWSGDAMVKVNSNDGSTLWLGNTGSGISNSTIAIDASGNTYHGTRSKGILSWNSAGTLRWSYTSALSSARYYASPALSADGSTLYAMMTNGEIYAINTADGTAKWTAPLTFTGDGTGTSLSIGSDGTVYYTTDVEIAAVTDNGTSGSLKWSYTAVGANSSGVVIGSDGVLYSGTSNGLVSLNSSDGSENWIYDSEVIEECVPAVDAKGNIYFGSNNGKLIVLNPLGEVLKILNLTTGVVNSPLIADDGSVYVEGFDGSTITLFKVNVNDGEGPSNSAWPMKGQNKRNTAMPL